MASLQRMRDALERRPLLTALLAWLVLLSITRGTVRAAADVEHRTWPVYVLLGLMGYSAFAVAFTVRRLPTSGLSPFLVRVALSASPTITGTGLAFQGASSWALWVALLSAGVLLTATVLITRTERAT